MWREFIFTIKNRIASNQRGFSLLEVVGVVGIIALFIAIVVGFNTLGSRNQKTLLAAGRQLASDVRSSVQVAESRSNTLHLQWILTSDYRNEYVIFREGEDEDNPQRYDPSDEVITRVVLEQGIQLRLPTDEERAAFDAGEWGSFNCMVTGSIAELYGLGFRDQNVVILDFDRAPAYKAIAVRIYPSGDTDVYRFIYAEKSGGQWIQAPLG